MNDFIKNPDFKEWTDADPDGWNIYNKNDYKLIEIDKVLLRRVYNFNILGIKFKIRGRNLIKPKFAKVPKFVGMKKCKDYEWSCRLKNKKHG